MSALQDRTYDNDSSSDNDSDTTKHTTTPFNGDGSNILRQYQDDLVIERSNEVYSDHLTSGNSSMPVLLKENSVFVSSCTNSSGTYWSIASPPALIPLGTIATATTELQTNTQESIQSKKSDYPNFDEGLVSDAAIEEQQVDNIIANLPHVLSKDKVNFVNDNTNDDDNKCVVLTTDETCGKHRCGYYIPECRCGCDHCMADQYQKLRCDDINGVAVLTINFSITYFRYDEEIGYMFTQARGNINEYLILLDSESSVNLIVNNNLLRNIRVVPNNT